jgi:F-type H+-transporting ATPase subunit gamma
LEYKIEPNPDQILEKLLYRFLRLQVYGAVLEANASEHSARMVAMKNATDNAGNLIDDLTLTYNTIRQNSITNEIAEISAGAESMR